MQGFEMGARRLSSEEWTEKWVDSVHGPGQKLSRQKSLGAIPEAQSPLRHVARYLTPPCWVWLSQYSRADLRADLVAGLTVSIVLVPQAIAYALLADMPPVNGLYTGFVPLIVFAATTTSRHMSVGPFALMSIVTRVLAREVVGVDAPRERHVETVLCISITAGAVQVATAVLGLGLGAAFLSDTSVAGFTTASALIIAGSQLQHLLGVPIPSGNLAVKLSAGFRSVIAGTANGYAAAVTVGALAFMLGTKAIGRRCCPGVPLFEQLLVVVLFTLLAVWLELPVPRVGDEGEVPSGLPFAHIPDFTGFSLEQNLALLQAGFTAGLTSFLLSMSIARTFALKHGYATSASAELLALGLSNLAGGCFGSYPVSGSLSRSALCSSVGGRTPLHGLVQAAVMALVLLGCTPLFAPLPYGVLAAIIFAALLALLDFELPAKLWTTSRADFGLWSVAFFGTVLFGVQPGLALALGSSLSLLVARASRPQCEVLGRLPGTELFRDVRRYPAALCTPAVLIFRFNAPLHFANAEFFCTRVRETWQRRVARGSPIGHLVLDCSAMCDIDHSANTALRGLLEELRAAAVLVLLAAARQALLERLRAFGTLGGARGLIAEEHTYVTLSAAIDFGVGNPPAQDEARCCASPTLDADRCADGARERSVLRMLTLEEASGGSGLASPGCRRESQGAPDELEAGASVEPATQRHVPGGLMRSASAVVIGVTEAFTQLTPSMVAEQRRGQRRNRVPTLEPSADSQPFARFSRAGSPSGSSGRSSGGEEGSDLRVVRHPPDR